MQESRKMITFDLDTAALQLYYPKENWQYAYEVIKNHMRKNGFSWKQGSVYTSDKRMTFPQADQIVRAVVRKNIWLHKCMRDCATTNIGAQFDNNHNFNKEFVVPLRDGKNYLN